jgi:PAS domain-containing protein
VRDEPLRALSVACAERGPWNVVALAEPFTGNGLQLRQLMLEIAGTTGLVMVGPRAQRVSGPPVAVVEDIHRLPDMLRTAERLAALDSSQIVVLLVASEEERLRRMDGEARLVVEGREDVRIESAEVTRGEAVVIAEALRRLRGGFVICQFGGLLVPDEGDLRPLAAVLESPLFVVR